MSMIVAGHFRSKALADLAVADLVAGGIQSDHILCSFDLADVSAAKPRPRDTDPGDTTIPGEASVFLSRGILVAVATLTEGSCAIAAEVLRRHGAYSVSESRKSLQGNKWVSLDPVPEWHPGWGEQKASTA